MTWLTWRQFRWQAWSALGILALSWLLLGTTGGRLAHLYTSSGLPGCAAARTVAACSGPQSVFFDAVKADGVDPLLFFVGMALLYLTPALIGMFWAAPLVARETEAGTLRLAWTQSVTRTRWLAVRAGLVGAAALLLEGLLSLAVSWWAAPIDRADALPGQATGGALPDRFMPLVFGARDLAPLGCAAFAFALGLCLGILLRRTVPAMAVTLGLLIAVQVLVPMVLRADYATPLRTTTALVMAPNSPSQIRIDGSSMEVSTPVTVPGAWVTSTATVDPAGHPFTGPVPAGCASATSTPADCDAAINALHLRQQVQYQPASRFWPFQWTETALYLLLALALTAAAFLRIRRTGPSS